MVDIADLPAPPSGSVDIGDLPPPPPTEEKPKLSSFIQHGAERLQEQKAKLKSQEGGPMDIRNMDVGYSAEKMTQFRKELTTRDLSKVGQVTGEQALDKIVGGAKTGAVIGGGVGLLGGPATAAGGAVMGGLSGAVGGGLSALAQNLGYSEKTQELADMIGAGLVPAQAGIKAIADNKLIKQTGDMVGELAKSMIPKYGTLRKVANLLTPEAKISGGAAQEAIGEKAITQGATVANRTAFKQELEQTHGQGANVSSLYEKAKGAYDEALSNATPQQLEAEFNKIGQALPQASRASSMNKIKQFFVDAKGNPLDGNAVINNIKSDEFKALSKLEQDQVRKAVNDFIPGRAEEVARKASEKEFVAIAKDTLPELFKSGNYNIINRQMGNFAKDEAGQKVFKQELAYYLKGRPVEEAKTLWTNIAPNVKNLIVKDPVQFQKIEDVINNAKTSKDVSRAVSLLMKAGYISEAAQTQGQ
ncbi:hypothetical protein UFOVP146_26 [uncultured Caudovirales phage]|uniref:Uncharacterized protein n=1 Tax=uncultured Caudovirales phage TaxID=2100421 RepID=A0A6J7VSW6_9CAUD|nr:hypothetical protein UFOVP146_26 [uncultured Caudovirales phage]